MIVIWLVSFLLAQISKADPTGKLNYDPEEKMNVIEVIRYHGYPVENYDVETEDGYILYLFRIPHGKNNSDSPRKTTPVYLQHGLAADSSCWIFDLPNKTLAFILADLGYDVYLGNIRGERYGLRHKTLDPDSDDFWKFSMDDVAKYDVPAIIDIILEKSGASRLHFIGHSMGTTIGFMLLSTKTEYNDKIRSFSALAPVAKLDHCKSPIFLALAPVSNSLSTIVKLFIGYKFLPDSSFIQILGATFCRLEGPNQLCASAEYLIAGFDYEQRNETRLPVYLHFFPAATSILILQQYGQILKYHRFQHYDYLNPLKNMKVYGQAIPPEYDLTKITTQVALYYGENDWLAQPLDVEYIVEKLQNKSLVLNYLVPYKKWNHFDFLEARNVVNLLYNKMIETLQSVWPDD